MGYVVDWNNVDPEYGPARRWVDETPEEKARTAEHNLVEKIAQRTAEIVRNERHR